MLRVRPPPRSGIDVVVRRTGGRGILRGKVGRERLPLHARVPHARAPRPRVGDRSSQRARRRVPRDRPGGNVTAVPPGRGALPGSRGGTPTSTSRACRRCSSSRARPRPPPIPTRRAPRGGRPARGPMITKTAGLQMITHENRLHWESVYCAKNAVDVTRDRARAQAAPGLGLLVVHAVGCRQVRASVGAHRGVRDGLRSI